MNPASNLVLVGPMGAGKSSIGRLLAERFGLAFADADRDVEARCGTSVSAIFEREGEAGFRARERGSLATLLAGDGLVLATGGGAVLDAGNRNLMRSRGFVVWLQAGVDEQLRRLARDDTRPLLRRADRQAALRRLAGEREPLYAEVADLRFDTDGLDAAAAAGALERQLDERWQRRPAATPLPRATP
jgi:shikimate kinase